MSKIKWFQIIVLILCLIIFGVSILVGVWESSEAKWGDQLLRWRGKRSVDSQILLVQVDDISMEILNKKWPWPRTLFARALKRIAQEDPAIIALDFSFSGQTNEKEDRTLQQVLASLKFPVVAGMGFYDKVEEHFRGEKATLLVQTGLDLPYFERFLPGFLNIPVDEDAVIRRTRLVREYQGEIYASFALRIYLELKNIKKLPRISGEELFLNDGEMIPLKDDLTLPINFAGPRGTFSTISFYQLLKENMLPSGFFRNKIVLVGPAFVAGQDEHLTPFLRFQGQKAKMPGMEIHAHILDTLLQKKYLKSFQGVRVSIWLWMLLWAVLLLSVTLMGPGWTRWAVISGFGLLYGLFIVFGFFVKGWLMPFAPLIGAVFATSVMVFVVGIFRQRNLNEQVKQLSEVKEEFKLDNFLSQFDITSREKEVLNLIIKDFTNPQISKKLYISLHTVKKHISNIYQKLNIQTRQELLDIIMREKEKSA